MKIEQVRQRAGVTEKYVPWAGATPVQWTCRVGCAALVAPAPGIPDIQKISVADSRPIRAGYKPDRFSIRRRS